MMSSICVSVPGTVRTTLRIVDSMTLENPRPVFARPFSSVSGDSSPDLDGRGLHRLDAVAGVSTSLGSLCCLPLLRSVGSSSG